MTIDNLFAAHTKLWADDPTNAAEKHADLSIQFAIEVLEELKQIAINRDFNYAAYDNLFYFKIQELKQYLDEKV
jgi:hypothetical protein